MKEIFFLLLFLIFHSNCKTIQEIYIDSNFWSVIETSRILYDDLYFYAINSKSSGNIYIYFLELYYSSDEYISVCFTDTFPTNSNPFQNCSTNGTLKRDYRKYDDKNQNYILSYIYNFNISKKYLVVKYIGFSFLEVLKVKLSYSDLYNSKEKEIDDSGLSFITIVLIVIGSFIGLAIFIIAIVYLYLRKKANIEKNENIQTSETLKPSSVTFDNITPDYPAFDSEMAPPPVNLTTTVSFKKLIT